MSAVVAKLTKKQKASLAFRTGKRQHQNKHHENELADMGRDSQIILESQGVFGLEGDEAEVDRNEDEEERSQVGHKEGNEVQRKKRKSIRQNKSNAESEDVPVSLAIVKGKKRKRRVMEGDEETADAQDEKRRKLDEGSGKARQKFILFIGNLKYTTTKEAIAQHFALCDPPPTIRLLTSKVKGSTQPKSKSKGCAFLEFTQRDALQQALKLHQSDLEGRLINVELTAGGGGKSESRLAKVRERNKGLLGQREKRVRKLGGNNTSTQPQRFSSTSGSLETPTTKKTWSTDDGQPGERHRKRSRSRQKSWGTGVNAIPVG